MEIHIDIADYKVGNYLPMYGTVVTASFWSTITKFNYITMLNL
jgi:hypothetical protein